ncbi:MAG: ATP-binding protein [Bryobacteraceae bacterium]|nr:ATP-binding protein [Bryobacteraceae bacterium]
MAVHTIETLSATPTWVSLRVPCQIENVDAVLEMLEPRDTQLDPKRHDEMCTAVRELLMNAIEHGGRNDPSLSVYLTCVKTHDAIMVWIRDPGPGFRAENLRHAAIANPPGGTNLEHAEIREAQGMRPGGFGIFMSRRMVDDLIYNEAGNEVLLVKSLR